MTIEPLIGSTDDAPPTPPVVRAPSSGRRRTIVAGLIVGALVLAGSTMSGRSPGAEPPGSPGAVLNAPTPTVGRLLPAERATIGDDGPAWQQVPLGEHRLQAAGEVAGRLVLALEDGDGTSMIGFVSPDGLVPGIAVTAPVDQVASWRNRLLLVGADETGPVLHLQHADGTVRRLGTARFAGGAPIQRFTGMAAAGNRLVGVAATPGPAVDLPADVRALLERTGTAPVIRGREVVVEAAPGIVVLRRSVPGGGRDASVAPVWVSPDGVGWRPVPWSGPTAPTVATLADGRVMLSAPGVARVTADGLTWEDIALPPELSGARGEGRLWSRGRFAHEMVVTAHDAEAWQPVDVSGLVPGGGWRLTSVSAGRAGYVLEMARPPQATTNVETDVSGVTVLVDASSTAVRLDDGTVVRPGALRADVDVVRDRVGFTWDGGSATVPLSGLMAAGAGERMVVTSPEGRRWSPAPVRAPGARDAWVSGSSLVIDDGDAMLVTSVD